MSRKGFTLIELLVVIGIIGMLAAAVLVAVAPGQRLQEALNARRSEETYSILNAILHKQSDDVATYNGETGGLIDTDPNTAQIIARTTVGASCSPAGTTTPTCPGATAISLTLPTTGFTCLALIDDAIENSVGVVDKYLALVPIDPRGEGADPTPTVTDLPLGTNNTGYFINRTSTGRVQVGACHPDAGASIIQKR